MTNVQTSSRAIIQGLNVSFEYGSTLPFEAIPSNGIALDGAVQGPQIDSAARRYSFDHHAGCIRMVTLATCQQVLLAIQIGLVVDEDTIVFVNDIDADTVLSTWLLIQALRAGAYDDVVSAAWLRDPRLLDLVAQIGDVDAHGPIFPVHPMHTELNLPYGDKTPQDAAMLARQIAKLDAWCLAPALAPPPRAREAGRGYAIRQNGEWEPVTTPDGFGSLYAAGFLAAALVTEANENTLKWTIGKRSDLVPLALGPATDPKSLLAKLRVLEGAPPAETWGGGSTIMGSPRRPGGLSSSIPEPKVVEVLRSTKIG
jgi:hypothetical protein